MGDPMDTSDIKIGIGRGRGYRWPNNRPGIGSPPKVAATEVKTETPEPSVRPKTTNAFRASTSAATASPSFRPSVRPTSQSSTRSVETEAERNARAEARTGISIDYINEYFKFDGDMSKFAPLAVRPNYNWANEPKVEVKQEDPKKNKKGQGIKYAQEAKNKERQRVKQIQREEKESNDSRSQSPDQNHSRREHMASNMSLQTSVSTNIESVGTYQAIERMDAITEDEETPALIGRYFPVKPRRPKLAITDYEDRIVKAVNACRVVIISGTTGCGKTTQVPQFIADDCADKGVPFNIVVTQPRRIAARSIAKRVADERGWDLGTIVGYQIGMDRQYVNEDTRLLYCTTGVLLQKLINQQRLDMYSHIIIDEVHERSIETDLLLLVIKKLMHTKSHSVKIILMSATIKSQIFKEYFTLEVFDDDDMVNEVPPSLIEITERKQELHLYYMDQIKRDLKFTFSVNDVRYKPSDPTEKDAPCITQEAMDVAVHILENGLLQSEESNTQEKGSVLVFLPGLEEIHEIMSRLNKSREKIRQQWTLIPLHSSIPFDKQNAVFERPRFRERKIILATNIAESSITVPDVEYVIDFCLTKNLVMDTETHIPVLKMEWASKANLDQRAGRAGRVRNGRVYRLIREPFQRALQDYQQPELQRSPLDLSILRVKMLNMGPPKDLLGLALSPPELFDIFYSVLQLKQVGALSIMATEKGRVYYEEEDGDITVLGQIISHLPIDIRLGKLICLGHVFDVLEDCIIIAACLSTQGMFRRDFGQGLNAYKSRMAWADRSFSDSIAHLNAYKTYKKFGSEFENDSKMAENWCKQNYIQYKRVKEVDYMVGELMFRLQRENIEVKSRPNLRRNRHEEELILKVVMCAAFYPHYFTRNEIEVINIPKELCNKDPKDSVSILGLPTDEGPLYTHAIREMFSICSKRIDISFEDTKAYLTFLDDKNPLHEAWGLHVPDKIKREVMNSSHSSLSTIKSEADRSTPMTDISLNSTVNSSAIHRLVHKDIKETTIKTAVYVAIAMRGNREINKDLPRIQKEVINRELKKLEKFRSEEHQRKMTFSSKRVSVPHVMTRMKLTRLPLPSLDCSELEIRVTHVETPNHFYAQYAHESTTEYMNQLSSIIAYELQPIPAESETIQIGDLVITEVDKIDGSKEHARARIDNIEYKDATKEVEMVTLVFIDYGIPKNCYNVKDLSLLTGDCPNQLFMIPPQAFRCSLSEVNPSPISCYDSCWSKKSIDYFRKFAKKSDTFTAKIYSVINRMVRLELFENVNREESFNDKLIGIGYAERWEESPPSRLNHEQRRREVLTRDESLGQLRLEVLDKKGVYDPDDVVELEIKFNPTQTQNIRTHDKIIIRGPHSPLECRFTGVSRQTSNRSINIDRGSVNCVVLEPDYLSKHTRLLVASSMGLSQNSGHINLRDTTLMPNIRGFPALMALLFAPRVQLRANKERTQYVGAICGLGYNKQNLKSYDPDFDAEVIFDSEISLQDMAKVNVIRFNISQLMKNRESLREYTENSLAIKQRKVRRNIIELLDRRRRLIDSTGVYSTFNWSDIRADDINSSLIKSDAELNSNLLPICEMQKLEPFDYFEDIRQNLNQLQAISEGVVSMTAKCKLCKFTGYCAPDVANHLLCDQHMDAIKDFNKEFKMNITEMSKQEYYRQRLEDNIDEEDVEIFDIDSDDDEVSIVF